MRPRSLHLSGFTAFRNPTDISFDGLELFALTGPTGSGKSSIIDAICFALYGSIPRLSGVEHVISLGKSEMRVRLVFDVDGQTYTISRLVARHGRGASQRDVRLEGPALLADGVREVDAEIEKLLGLRFEHFTRCVVLPQGRFAAFLDDGPAARERLLKQLLDLGVYEEMRKRAGSHAMRLEGEIAGIDGQLHDLLVEGAQVEEAERALATLTSLRERVGAVAARIEAMTSELRQVEAEAAMSAADMERLASVAAPDGLEALAAAIRIAADDHATAVAALLLVAESMEEISVEREELGELAAIDAAIEAHRRVADLRERVAKGEQIVEEASRRRDVSNAAAAEARGEAESAAAVLRDLERRYAAHALRRHLVPGDECPVCLQTVAPLPTQTAPEGMADAEMAVAAAGDRAEAAQAVLSAAEAELAGHLARLEQRRIDLAAAAEVAAGLPPLDELLDSRQRLVTANERWEQARRDHAAAAVVVAEAEARRTANEAAVQDAAARLDRTRDALAGLGPPLPGREDVIDDWQVLVTWCEARRAEVEERHAGQQRQVEQHRSALQELEGELRADARAAGVESRGGDVGEAVVEAAARAGAALERLRNDLTRKNLLVERRVSSERERGRYDETAKLLRSNQFQQWLIEEALVGLVEFANSQLVQLAGGAYSLSVTGGEFEVIDHRNAEARRSVKTLSGGETFLVSLALALALAERVVATSAIGTARIESMFLDEGFGTLDADTLDTVASVVVELGSTDRMVGLVTHVRELAEQIPVRFEVRKLPDGATVTKVET